MVRLNVFEGVYSIANCVKKSTRKNKISKLRDSVLFFEEFVKTVNELKSAGTNVSEKEKLNYMLNRLPKSYSYIDDLIDTLR